MTVPLGKTAFAIGCGVATVAGGAHVAERLDTDLPDFGEAMREGE